MIGQWVVVVKFGVELLPSVIKAVQAVEDLFPQGGAGAQKAAMVVAVVQKAYDAAHNVIGEFETIRPVVEGMIAAVVKFCNDTGIFQHKSAA